MRKFITTITVVGLAAAALVGAPAASAAKSEKSIANYKARVAEYKRTTYIPPGHPNTWGPVQLTALINSRLPAADNNKIQMRDEWSKLPCSSTFYSKKLQLTPDQLNTTPIGVFATQYTNRVMADLRQLTRTREFRKGNATTRGYIIAGPIQHWMQRFRQGVSLVACASGWDPTVNADGTGTLMGYSDTSLLNYTGVNWRNPLVQAQLAAWTTSKFFSVSHYPESDYIREVGAALKTTGSYDKSFLQADNDIAGWRYLAEMGKHVTVK